MFRSDDDGGSPAVSSTSPTLSAQVLPFWGAGITVRRLGHLVDELPGGRQSLDGLEIYKCWRGDVLCPFSKLVQPSLCERLQAEGDAGVGIATWYVGYTFDDIFLHVLEALEFFVSGEPQGLDTVIWFSIASSGVCFTPSDDPLLFPLNDAQKIKRVVQGTRNLVMFMTTWDNPSALTSAWCLWELFCCCSCGGRAEFVLPRAQREQLHDALRSRPARLLESIPTARSEDSTCFKVSSQENVFAAISAEVSFSGLDAIVRSALEEWFQQLLRGRCKLCFLLRQRLLLLTRPYCRKPKAEIAHPFVTKYFKRFHLGMELGDP